MAKVYGERWRVVRSLASGGQAEVFIVRDTLDENSEEFVLKRVRNPKRHDRFCAEVEAIKRLNHKNIIQLIEHSALASGEIPSSQQFIVMPYANHGDLSKRVSLYKGNIDSVLQVAKSLAFALQAAHDKNIIHRDVKPQNILFPTVSHDVWLSDFGICLIRDQERATPADEVVGPVQFMAPELEEGGQLDVSPSADIYSLGKVIYYMLSGGVVLPRERLHEEEYAKIFRDGERGRLLETLLSRMICNISNRLPSMQEVITQLERIENWERDARLLPVQRKTLSAIETMKQRALEIQQKTEINADTRSRRNARIAAASEGTLGWFRSELEKMSAHIRDENSIFSGIRVVGAEENDGPRLNDLRVNLAVEMWVRNKYETFQREHLFRINICTKFKITVTSRVITGKESSMRTPPDEAEHAELVILPAYGRKTQGGRSSQAIDWQFFTSNGRLHRVQTNPNRHFQGRMGRSLQPQQQVELQAIRFSTSDWPAISDSFSGMLQKTLDIFIAALSVDSGPFG